MKDYQPRIVDEILTKTLRFMSAVLIEGPRYSGKTESARQQAKSEVLLDVDSDARLALSVNPAMVLEGATPRLIDEWQSEPESWNLIRRSCDDRRSAGQFILTGSAAPTEDITRHSGAGRIARLKMRPMSLFEQGLSNGTISLKRVFGGQEVSSKRPDLAFDDVVESICRGGWPAIFDFGINDSLRYSRSYLEEIVRTDLTPELRFDTVRMRRLLGSISRHIATNASHTTLRLDVDPAMNPRTFTRYLSQLERIQVVEPQFVFSTHLRSKATLRTSPKHHFCDPSLAVAALGAHPDTVKNDLGYFGFLFESLVIRDLRIYAEANDANVYFYRDSTGLEVDAIIQETSGRWLAIEIKLGGNEQIDAACKNLLRLKERVDKRVVGEPVKMLVVTCTPSFGYERKDGISVASVGCLGP